MSTFQYPGGRQDLVGSRGWAKSRWARVGSGSELPRVGEDGQEETVVLIERDKLDESGREMWDGRLYVHDQGGERRQERPNGRLTARQPKISKDRNRGNFLLGFGK
jgi:hypothetical protein